MVLLYTTVHCTTLHYTTPHCTALHHTALHYTRPHCTALHYATPGHTTLHYAIVHCIIIIPLYYNRSPYTLIIFFSQLSFSSLFIAGKTSRKSLRSYGQSPDNSELNSSSFARTTIAFPLTSPVSTSHSHSTALPPSDTISLNIYPRRTSIPKDRPIPLGKISGEFDDSEEGVEMSDVDLVSKLLGISTVLRPKIHPPSEKNGVRSNSTDIVSKGYFMDSNGQDLHQNQLDPSATIRDEEKTHDFAERNLNQHNTLVSDASDSNTDGTVAPLRRVDNGDKHCDSYNNISAINKLSANTNSDSPEKKTVTTPNDDSHYGILRLKI